MLLDIIHFTSVKIAQIIAPITSGMQKTQMLQLIQEQSNQ